MCRTQDGIELRVMQLADVEKLVALAIWPDEVFPVQGFRQALTEDVEMHARGEGLACAIWIDERMIGYIRLHVYGRGYGELHYGLAPSYRGRGIVTRACAELIAHAFRHLDLESIKVRVRVSNRKSCAVPARLGFERTGTSRLPDENDCEIETAEYVMTKEAWQRRQS